MDFFQTVGGQALASVLKSSLPKIATGLDRIATAMEKRNELLARQETVETHEHPELTRDMLEKAMLEAMGRTPYDKREESAHE